MFKRNTLKQCINKKKHELCQIQIKRCTKTHIYLYIKIYTSNKLAFLNNNKKQTKKVAEVSVINYAHGDLS